MKNNTTLSFNKLETQLASLAKSAGIRYSLEPMIQALELLGNPHKKLKHVIHIAGTNGKGSTAHFLASALQSKGLSVGLYTSPHLVSYTERIQVNRTPISEANFLHSLNTVIHTLLNQNGPTLTEFELLTCAAFLHFRAQNLEWVILETGLGGRLDATNVVLPTVSVITSIGYDHEAILGSSLGAIAAEKAGIIKPNTPVFSTLQDPRVAEVLTQTAQAQKSPLSFVPPLSTLPPSLPLQGRFQQQNLALAQAVLNHLFPATTWPDEAFSNTHHWGRFTVLKKESQTLIFDAAHNLSGVEALCQTLKSQYPEQPITVVTGILKTKKAEPMLKELQTVAQKIYYCPFSPEAWSYDILKNSSQNLLYFDPKTIPHLPNDPIVVVTGSIYFLGLFRLYFSNTH